MTRQRPDSMLVAYLDRNFDAFCNGAIRQRGQYREIHLIKRNVHHIARIYIVEMVMSMGA